MIAVAMPNLWEEYAVDRNNIGLRNQLIEQYMGLVEEVCCQVMLGKRKWVEADSLREIGYYLLVALIEHYELGDVPFPAFARPRLRWAMLRNIREQRGRAGPWERDVAQPTATIPSLSRFWALTAFLPDAEKVALLLCKVHHKSYREVAGILLLSPDAIRRLVRSAIERLRQRYDFVRPDV